MARSGGLLTQGDEVEEKAEFPRTMGSRVSMRVRLVTLQISLWGFALLVLGSSSNTGTHLLVGANNNLLVLTGLLLLVPLVLVVWPLQPFLDRGTGVLSVGLPRLSVAVGLLLGAIILLFSMDLVAVSYMLAPGFVLEALMSLTTSIHVNHFLLILAAFFGMVSVGQKLSRRDRWREWGALSLLVFAVGLGATAWYMLRLEGLMGASMPDGFPLALLEQAGFWCWIGLSMTLVRRGGRLGRMGIWLSIGFAASTVAVFLTWAWDVGWPSQLEAIYQSGADQGFRVLARAALYFGILFLIPIMLRGVPSILGRDQSALRAWFVYLACLVPLLVLLILLVVAWVIFSWFSLRPGLWYYFMAVAGVLVGIAGSAGLGRGIVSGRRLALLAVACSLALSSLPVALVGVSAVGENPLAYIRRGVLSHQALGMLVALVSVTLASGMVILSMTRRLWAGGLWTGTRHVVGDGEGSGLVGRVMFGLPLVMSGLLLLIAGLRFLVPFHLCFLSADSGVGATTLVRAQLEVIKVGLPLLVYVTGCVVAARSLSLILPRLHPGQDG